MTKIYCLMYDTDNGGRENWNPFYMIPGNVEAYSTEQARDERVKVLNAIFAKLEDPNLEDVTTNYSVETFELEVLQHSTLGIPEDIQKDLTDLAYEMTVSKENDELSVEVADKQEAPS